MGIHIHLTNARFPVFADIRVAGILMRRGGVTSALLEYAKISLKSEICRTPPFTRVLAKGD